MHLYFLAAIAASAVVAIIGWNFKNKIIHYIFKPVTTAIIIGMCVYAFFTAPDAPLLYLLLILIGLVLSLTGDIVILIEGDTYFIMGLSSFVLAHLSYTAALLVFGTFGSRDILSGAILLLLSGVIFTTFRKKMGALTIPVAVYLIVISFMVWRAFGTFAGNTFRPTQAILLSTGAFFFYISDILIGVDKFLKPVNLLRFFNLTTYYIAQTLITLSCFYF